MWGGCLADHSLKSGSGGFEVKLVESFPAQDADSVAPDGRDFSAMCRIGWTVKDRNERFCFNHFIKDRGINTVISKTQALRAPSEGPLYTL